MSVREREEVHTLLNAMRGGPTPAARHDALRRLLAQLNYTITRQPVSVGLPADVLRQVADPPQIIATAAESGFLVIHTRLSTPNLPRLAERAVVTALLKNHPYALFVFANADSSRWHLLNVKVARREASDENRDPKLRRLFRRISIAPEDRLRTATERIEKLDLAAINPELFGLSPLAVQEAHDDAFDVEAVTKQFFHEYKRVFEYVEDAITGIRGEDKRRLFTQRLFNRLMFIAFIQKKGWLKFPGMQDNEYLEALWRDYQEKKKGDSNFYADRLSHLFFFGLNNAAHVDMLATNRGHSAPSSFLQRRIGDVPYLNGGLFERSDDGTDAADSEIAIPDKAINAILHELFARFNFTVTESTPLDVEVAVDPEMLGKVFEELITGRHESGSYYTPKPIVSFMCREALKGYLQTKCPNEKAETLARFVDEHDASRIRDGEAVLEALKTVKCCDPACGSGAYLLGMMHELLDLRQTLFRTDQKLDPVSVYQRKLDIIQTNVYGVDVDPFAVNIARLRLWLSLAVDFDGDSPPPLPNLDFKIEAGDSLAAPDPSNSGQLQLQKPLVDDFLRVKREFLLAHSAKKKELKAEIDRLRDRIRSWTHSPRSLGANVFDWQVEFAEVFIAGGFDVVLANPPYVEQRLITEQKPTLKKVFPAIYSGNADLFCYFYGRAIQLLAKGGSIVFISSNKWFRASYGAKLREFLADSCAIHLIIDFGDLPVFDAVAYPSIFSATKGPCSESVVFVPVTALGPPYPDLKEVVAQSGRTLEPGAIRGALWNLTEKAVLTATRCKASMSLREFVGAEVFRGISTGLNDAFFIDGETRAQLIADDRHSEEIIKPAALGKDVKRWSIENRDRWIIYSPWDLEIDRFPAVKSHLEKWKGELSARPECRAGRYRWWCMARYGSEYAHAFNKLKIVSTKVSLRPTFALDRAGYYLGNTAYLLPVSAGDSLFVLALLNSSVFLQYAKETFVEKQNGWFEIQPEGLEHFPIIPAAGQKRERIEALAKQCVNAQGSGACDKHERELDERVAALYGL